MNSTLSILGVLVLGFLVYFLIKDKIFDNSDITSEKFEVPAPASIELRQAPIYPERTITPSGPNPPNQMAHNNEIVYYNEPVAKDPYLESQESSDIPENLRHPERSFRPPPLNENTSIATQSGIANNNTQISSDNSQTFQPEFIQGGGEFMPGIFANDTFNDTNFSAF